MRTERRQNSRIGQSTIELALLLPIAVALLVGIIRGFGVNHDSSERAMQSHELRLTKFDHGNGSILFPDGIEIPAGELRSLVSPLNGINFTNALLTQAVGAIGDIGLSMLFDKVDFLNADNWYGGALKGATLSAWESFYGSGFETVNLETVGWGALAGAAASGDATEFFQGESWEVGGTAQEFLGSGLQQGLIGYSESQGDPYAALAGLAGGMLNSNTSVNWFENGEADLVKGALRGAIQGSVSGLSSGEFDLKTVAVSTVMGAVNTETFASIVPGSGWGGGDPTKSATFTATSAAIGTLLNGGDTTDVLLAASSGALFSNQSMGYLAGDSELLATGIGAAYGAGVSLIQGQSGEEVVMGTVQNAVIGLASSKLQQTTADLFSGAGSTEEIENLIAEQTDPDSPLFQSTVDATTEQFTQALPATGEGFANGMTAPAASTPVPEDVLPPEGMT